MSLVKWVDEYELFPSSTIINGWGGNAIPVIPLSALREVVEGLRQLADPFYGSSEELNDWMSSKSKEPFSQWLAQRLLTQLAEIPTQDAGAARK